MHQPMARCPAQALHANALFREFRGVQQRGSGAGEGMGRGPTLVDDFQAEGQARM